MIYEIISLKSIGINISISIFYILIYLALENTNMNLKKILHQSLDSRINTTVICILNVMSIFKHLEYKIIEEMELAITRWDFK